ncbi:Uncharacterised protein [Vibrio cholerae]|uniref:Uncharacterized protein n=1 Tax=Vibrio cholerae TaxID=666 RepID=A0A655R1Y6_VIBCL|nr:Uncharacterised protein [Vibrio cholerae]
MIGTHQHATNMWHHKPHKTDHTCGTYRNPDAYCRKQNHLSFEFLYWNTKMARFRLSKQ